MTFLNGFEISSQRPKNTYYTPFEVQVVVKNIAITGITLLISTTSATQIHSLFVSYIAYDPSIPNLMASYESYDKYIGTNT